MSEVHLVTLTEASEIMGISVDALRQRIKRGRIPAHRGNDGRVRIRLEPADIEALRADQTTNSTGLSRQSPTSRLEGESRLISLIERLMTPLVEQNEHLKQEIRQVRQESEQAESRAQHAEIRAESAVQEENKVRTQLAEAQSAAGQALAEAAALRLAVEERERWSLTRRLRWAIKRR